MKKRFASALYALVVAGMTIAFAPPLAQPVFAGHDETSEVSASFWATGARTPGTAPVLTADHLLLTEIVVTPTANELIEIHNPLACAIDLTKYYLTDAWFVSAGIPNSYHLLPTGTFSISTNTDFCVRFPAGASIPAGGTLVIALYGPGVDSTFGAGTADYEITSVSPTIPDMVNVGNNSPPIAANSTTLTNGSEFVMLFFWDGVSDNVCDVDYVTWGSSSGLSRVDKTGLAVDGPDADAIATPYNPDTPIASQSSVTSPGSGSSTSRLAGAEGAEASGGNGCLLASVGLEFNPGMLNLNSHGRWVTAYLEPVAPHLASDIDVSSLYLNGTVQVDPDAPVSVGDEDNDGIPDLMVKFSRADVAALLSPGDDVAITVTGSVGTDCFAAGDMIKVIAVTLPSPAAGSVVLSGSRARLEWNAGGGPPTVDLIASYDDGATWTVAERALPNTGVHDCTVPSVTASRARVGIVLIASENAPDLVIAKEFGESGAFAIESTVGVGDGPIAFALRGVHPNPGRGSLNVLFSLLSEGSARLVVYDVTGREVAARDVSGLGAGHHVVSFGQRERLRAGVYLVQLNQAGRSARTRAVVIE